MPEKKEIEWKSWGVSYEKDGIKHQIGYGSCEHCPYQDEDDFGSYIVGFSEEECIIVVECPKCFKLMWCHTTNTILRGITEFIEMNPDFLKVLEAREEFLEMFKKQKKK